MSHLDSVQRRALRVALQQRERAARAALRNEAGGRADAPYAELAGDVADAGDAAAADLAVDVDNALIGMHLAELRDIRDARERIRRGCYGACVDCSAAIDYERLCAYPTAKRCVRCQQFHERTFAAPPHAAL